MCTYIFMLAQVHVPVHVRVHVRVHGLTVRPNSNMSLEERDTED